MPNWVEGTFRARGTRENIEKFALNGLEPVGFFGNEAGKIELTHQWDDELDFRIKKDDDSPKQFSLWIKNTRRHFLECTSFEAYKRKDGLFSFYCPFKAAWSIDDDSIAAIAKDFGIKIKVNGYERGMEFEQTVEADEFGNIVLSEEKEYDDYEWECPMPGMGG